MSNEYLIKQGDSIIFDQIKRLRGYTSSHISEMVLIVAKKNPKTEKELKRILDEGFYLNGIHYNRFGKSASQGKDGITAFVCDAELSPNFVNPACNVSKIFENTL